MTMTLNRNQAYNLMVALDKFCRKRHIKLSRNLSIRYLELANIILSRYGGVILVEGSIKYLCNNPKHLKKFALQESIKKASPIITRACDRLAKYDSL